MNEMNAQSEAELRKLIIKNLKTCGFLNKIKAELRAGVFLAFEEEGSLRQKIPFFNKTFDDFLETSNGKLVVSIVREFLEYFKLNFTLSVFDPEIATDSACLNRSDLCAKLNIKNSELDGPVLSALLKSKLGPETGKQGISNQNSGTHIGHPIAATSKSLETISEDYPANEKSCNGTFQIINNSDGSLSSTFDISENSEKERSFNKTFSKEMKTSLADTSTKVKSSMIESLKNEFGSSEYKEEEKLKVSEILSNDKSDVTDIFKSIVNSSPDHDPFFDEPVPSEKPSFFNLPKEKYTDSHNLKDVSQNELNSPSTLGSEKNSLSSLRDFPSLTSKGKDWKSSQDFQKTLPSLDSAKPVPLLGKSADDEKDDIDVCSKKNPDSESNEESSDNQVNSEESIEEELEEDFSGCLDDILNSSLSLADDATSDQSVSQVSVVDGVDHIEPCNSVN